MNKKIVAGILSLGLIMAGGEIHTSYASQASDTKKQDEETIDNKLTSFLPDDFLKSYKQPSLNTGDLKDLDLSNKIIETIRSIKEDTIRADRLINDEENTLDKEKLKVLRDKLFRSLVYLEYDKDLAGMRDSFHESIKDLDKSDIGLDDLRAFDQDLVSFMIEDDKATNLLSLAKSLGFSEKDLKDISEDFRKSLENNDKEKTKVLGEKILDRTNAPSDSQKLDKKDENPRSESPDNEDSLDKGKADSPEKTEEAEPKKDQTNKEDDKEESSLDSKNLKEQIARADDFKSTIFYQIGNKNKLDDFEKAYGNALGAMADLKDKNKSLGQEDIDTRAKDLKDKLGEVDFSLDDLDSLEDEKKRLNTLIAFDENIKSYINNEQISQEAVDNYKKVLEDVKAFRDSDKIEEVRNAYKRLYESIKKLEKKGESSIKDRLSSLVKESEDFKNDPSYKKLDEDSIFKNSYKALILEARAALESKDTSDAQAQKIYDHILATKSAIKGDMSKIDWLLKNEIYLEDKVKAKDKYKKIQNLANSNSDAESDFYKNLLSDYDSLLKKAKEGLDKDLSDSKLHYIYKSLKSYREFLTDEDTTKEYLEMDKKYLLLSLIKDHRAFELLPKWIRDNLTNILAFVEDNSKDKSNTDQIKINIEKLDEIIKNPQISKLAGLITDYGEDSKIFDLNQLVNDNKDLKKDGDIKYTKAQAKHRKEFNDSLALAEEVLETKETDETLIGEVYERFKKAIKNLDGDQFEPRSFALADKFKKDQKKIKDAKKRLELAEEINTLATDKTKTMDDIIALEKKLEELTNSKAVEIKTVSPDGKKKDVVTTTKPVDTSKKATSYVKTGIKGLAKVVGILAAAAIILFLLRRKGDKNEK